MKRLSARTALTASGLGLTVLLAGCGAGGSSSVAESGPSEASAVETGPASGDLTSQTPQSATSTESAGQQTSPDSHAPESSASEHSATSTKAGTKTSSTDSASHRRSATAQPPAAGSGSKSKGDKPVPLCTVKQLRITVAGGNADMQGSHRSLRFTNASNSVCKLTGAPGVSYVAGNDGHQVGLPAKRIVGHQPIVLIPNATASAGLFISSAPRKSGCATTTARGIRVYPPDSYQAAFVPLTEVTCSAAKSGPYLKVGPILPGPNNTV